MDERQDGGGRDGTAQVRRAALGLLGVQLIALVGTGVALFFVYRPATAQVWAGIDAPSDAVVAGLRVGHRLLSALALLTALAVAALFVAGRAPRGRVMPVALGVALVLAVAAASVTGFLLPWDQMALWSPIAGSGMNGFRPLLGDDVRFVLVDGAEVRPGTVLRWLGVHALLFPPLAAAVLALIWRRGRRPRLRQPPS